MVVVFQSLVTWNLKSPHWEFMSSSTQVRVTRVSPVSALEKIMMQFILIWRIRIEIRLYRPFVPTSLTQKFAGNWPTWPSWNGTMTFWSRTKWMNEWMNDDYALRSTFGTMQFLVYSLFAGDIGSCNYTYNHNFVSSLHYHGEVWTISLSKEAGETK